MLSLDNVADLTELATTSARINKLEDFAEKLVGKLDAQDEGVSERGECAGSEGARP